MGKHKSPRVWDQIVEDWKLSTATKKEFCSQIGIRVDRFDYQLRKRNLIRRACSALEFPS